MPGPLNLDKAMADWTLADACNRADASNWTLLTASISVTEDTGNNRLTSQDRAVRIQNVAVTSNIFAQKTQAVGYGFQNSQVVGYGVWETRDFDNVNAGTYYNDSFLAITNAAGTKTYGHPAVTRWQNGPNVLAFGRGDMQDTAATGYLIGTDDDRRLRLRFTGKTAGLIDVNLLGVWKRSTKPVARFILQVDDVWETGRAQLAAWYAAHGWRYQMSYAHDLQPQGQITPVGTVAADVALGRGIAVNHSKTHVAGMIASYTAQQWVDDYLANAEIMRQNGLLSVSKYGYRSTDAWVMPFGRLMQDKINIGRANGCWWMTNGDGGGNYAGTEQFWLNGWGFPVGYNLLNSNSTESAIRQAIRSALATGSVCVIVLHGLGTGGDPSATNLQWRILEEELLAAERAGAIVGQTVLDVMDYCHQTYGPRPTWW